MLELLPRSVGATEPPVVRRNIVGHDDPAVVGPYLEGKALAVEVSIALPAGTPVPAHYHPVSLGPLDPHLGHHAATADIFHRDELKVVVPVDGEPHASTPLAGNPPVVDGHNAGLVDSDGLPRGLRHVEVLPRRVAPSAVVAGQGVVGRAEVGGRDGDGRALFARRRLACAAGDGEAHAARCAVVEERRAQRG